MLAGVTCIAAGLLSGEEQLRWLQVALALVGKFGATARWELGTDSSSKFFPFSSISVIFLYTAEMFPTEIRFSFDNNPFQFCRSLCLHGRNVPN